MKKVFGTDQDKWGKDWSPNHLKLCKFKSRNLPENNSFQFREKASWGSQKKPFEFV